MATKSETKQIGEFDRIELRYYGRLHITQGDVPSLTVEADEEVLSKLKSEVRNGTLYLELGGEWWDRVLQGFRALGQMPITYNLTAPRLKGISVAGRGEVEAERLEADDLELASSGLGRVEVDSLVADRLTAHISGRGDFRIKGRVREQKLVVSGSGDYRAGGLESQRASVHISGHGNAVVRAAETLDVTISGYGRVDYHGDPRLSQSISGSGRVERVEPEAV